MLHTLLSIIIATSTLVNVQASPFDEGVVVAPLTELERNDLAQYAESSKARLTEALSEAQGKTFGESNDIYMRAIREVVEVSHSGSRRSELLMRMALNQASELSEVLQNVSNRDLITIVFEDSIKLALTYIQEDQKAVANGSLRELPYLRFSLDRLLQAREWGAAISETSEQYIFTATILRQWTAVARHQEQPHRAAIAPELLRIDSLLRKLPPTDEVTTKGRMRVLRRELRKLIEDLGAVLHIELDAIKASSLTPAHPPFDDVKDPDDFLEEDRLATYEVDLNLGVTQSLSNGNSSHVGAAIFGKIQKQFPLVVTRIPGDRNIGPAFEVSGRLERFGDNASNLDRSQFEVAAYLVGFRPHADDKYETFADSGRFFGNFGEIRYAYDSNPMWGTSNGYEVGLGHAGWTTPAAIRKRGGFVFNAAITGGSWSFGGGDYSGSDGKKYNIGSGLVIRPEFTIGYCKKSGGCLTNKSTAKLRSIDLSINSSETTATVKYPEFEEYSFTNDTNLNFGRYLNNNVSLGVGYHLERQNIKDNLGGPNDNRIDWRQMLYLKGSM